MVDFVEILEYPGYYVDAAGNVYSRRYRGVTRFDRPLKKLTPHPDGSGNYLQVSLTRDGHKAKSISVHFLICEAFHGKKVENMTVSHLNGDSRDNRAENLTWESAKQNSIRKITHGTDDCGIKNSRAKFNIEEIQKIRELLAQGITARKISELFNCNWRLIGKIKRKEHYKR